MPLPPPVRVQKTREIAPTAAQRTVVAPVLVPIDFEEGSTAALNYAARLAANAGRAVWLLHVLPPSSFIRDVNSAMVSAEDDEPARTMHAALEQFGRGTRDEGLRVHSLVRAGKAPHEICEAARELGAALIVLRTNGVGGSLRWFGRHTAEQVIAMAPCPVLSIPRDCLPDALPSPGTARRILVPVDLSLSSAHSLRYAASLAQRSSAEVTLLHVVRLPTPSYRSDAYFPDQVPDELRENAARELAEWAAHHVPAGLDVERLVRFSFNPAEAVLNFAGHFQPQLIVITPEKRSWLGRVLRGSVTRQLIRHVRSPLLCLNRPEPGGSATLRRSVPPFPLL